MKVVGPFMMLGVLCNEKVLFPSLFHKNDSLHLVMQSLLATTLQLLVTFLSVVTFENLANCPEHANLQIHN